MKRVHEAAERARYEWRANNDARFVVNLPFIAADERGPLHLDERLSVSAAKRVFAGDGFSNVRNREKWSSWSRSSSAPSRSPSLR